MTDDSCNACHAGRCSRQARRLSFSAGRSRSAAEACELSSCSAAAAATAFKSKGVRLLLKSRYIHPCFSRKPVAEELRCNIFPSSQTCFGTTVCAPDEIRPKYTTTPAQLLLQAAVQRHFCTGCTTVPHLWTRFCSLSISCVYL